MSYIVHNQYMHACEQYMCDLSICVHLDAFWNSCSEFRVVLLPVVNMDIPNTSFRRGLKPLEDKEDRLGCTRKWEKVRCARVPGVRWRPSVFTFLQSFISILHWVHTICTTLGLTCAHNHPNRVSGMNEYFLHVGHPGVLNDLIKCITFCVSCVSLVPRPRP